MASVKASGKQRGLQSISEVRGGADLQFSGSLSSDVWHIITERCLSMFTSDSRELVNHQQSLFSII